MLIQLLKKQLYKSGAQNQFSLRRLRFIDQLLDGAITTHHPDGLKLLDAGCSYGKDLITFLSDRDDLAITGIDIRDYGLRQGNFDMILSDAEAIPFPDAYFDVTLSIGVLEHIKPIEKLSRVISEINRVSKAYVIIVPSISTIIEPHTARPLWQLQDYTKKPPYSGPLFHMSDDAWLEFEGFSGAQSCRFWHIPPFVENLCIYRLP